MEGESETCVFEVADVTARGARQTGLVRDDQVVGGVEHNPAISRVGTASKIGRIVLGTAGTDDLYLLVGDVNRCAADVTMGEPRPA